MIVCDRDVFCWLAGSSGSAADFTFAATGEAATANKTHCITPLPKPI